jgi:hypothetical protein
MIAIFAALTLVLAAMLAVNYAASLIREWMYRRQVVRRSAADQEMQAMRAARQLSLMAWQARHQMYDIASAGRASRSEHPARHQ